MLRLAVAHRALGAIVLDVGGLVGVDVTLAIGAFAVEQQSDATCTVLARMLQRYAGEDSGPAKPFHADALSTTPLRFQYSTN